MVMVLKHDEQLARKTTFCECVRMGDAVAVARLCNKNKCVVATFIVTSFNVFRKTPGSTFKYAYFLIKNSGLGGFLFATLSGPCD